MIIFLIGLPGDGKTFNMTKLCVLRMLEHGIEDWSKCSREVKKLNEGGFSLLEPPAQYHTCFADYEIKINKRLKAYAIDGFKIGLPNPYFETVFIPPYSTIFLDEAQRYYNSRMSKFLREEVYLWYQFHRHNDYTIYMACQRLGNIDLNIRSLGEKFIVFEGLDVEENDFGIPERITSKFRVFNSCESAEEYCLSKDKREYSKFIKLEKETTFLNIFNYYNPKSCKPFFYLNRNNQPYDYYTEEGYQFTKEGFIEYNNSHFYCAPKGFWKNAERDKLILKGLKLYNGN